MFNLVVCCSSIHCDESRTNFCGLLISRKPYTKTENVSYFLLGCLGAYLKKVCTIQFGSKNIFFKI